VRVFACRSIVLLLSLYSCAPSFANMGEELPFVQPPVWGTYNNWGFEDISTGLGPDGLYQEFRVGRRATSEQLNQGLVTFIDGKMPLDFVFFITTEGRELTLYPGGDGKPFTEHLTTNIWYGGGSPRPNEVDLTVLGVQLPERFKTDWKQLLAQKLPVVLRRYEGIMVRVRVVPKKDVWSQPTPQTNQPDKRSLRLAIGVDFGAVPGNEELRAILYKRPGGRAKEVYTASVAFTLVRKAAITTPLLVEYNLWRINYAKWAVRHDWKKVDQKTVIEGYENLLKLMPGTEQILWMFIRDLEKMGKYPKLLDVMQRLIDAVKAEPRAPFPLGGWELDGLMVEDPGPVEPLSADNLVKVLTRKLNEFRAIAAKL